MTLRRSGLAALIVLAVATPAIAQRNVRLEQHESEAGKFRVKLPEKPESDTKELALGPGGRTVQFTTERADGPDRSVFAVTFADYPESYRQVPIKTVLDGVRDGLKGTDGKVEKDDEVFLGTGADKLAGREFRIVAGQKVVRVRVFLQGTRLYQVMATGSKQKYPTKAVEEFLNSFELVK
ncbi:MAG TPA: hypothetical protein VM533_11430 [Fimbriiglobus sp.]|jgi:hypothetical protein|nr:hypothetical protein [Fimbriiglobus sp.]